MKLFKFIFVLFCLTINAQKVQTFRFIVANKENFDTYSGFYPGKPFEFTYSRVYDDKNNFREIGLFDGNKNGTLFKIKNKKWYIKNGNIWKIFYSPGKKINPNVKIAGKYYTLKIIDYQVLNGTICTVYNVITKKRMDGGKIEYWFNPQYGIVQIKTDNITLVREDFKTPNG